MNKAKKALSMSYVVALVDYLVDSGFSQSDILAGSLIKPADLKNKKSFISKNQYVGLISNVIKFAPLHQIVSGVMRESQLTQHGLLGLLAVCGFNLEQVLSMLLRFSSLRMNLVDFKLEKNNQLVTLHIEPIHGLDETEIFTLMITSLAMVKAKRQICHLIGEYDQINFSFPEPNDFHGFAGFDNTKIKFNAEKNTYQFPVAELKQKIKSGDEPTFDMLSSQCENLLEESSTDCLVEKIKSHLKKVEGDFPSLETLASELHMSTRSLSRHLKNKKSSFQELLQQEKIERAKKLLRYSQLSLTEIASALYFSDSSYMAKVFKKQINMTPTAYRRASQ